MRKAIKQIAVCAVALLAFCLICRFAFSGTYRAYIPLAPGETERFRQEEAQAEMDAPGIVEIRDRQVRDGYLQVDLRPGKRGETGLTFRTEAGNETPMRVLRVDRFGTIYDMNTGDFNGANEMLIAVTVFWLLVSAIMLWHYTRAKGPAFYAYATIYYVGFFLFALLTGLTMLRVTVMHIINPRGYAMFSAYETIDSASSVFMRLTAPAMVAFALAMGISNLVLLRHEHPSPRNLLGILVSLLLLSGEALGWYLFTRDFVGSEMELRLRNTAENTYATVFIYFECMLMGAVICGLQAAKLEPTRDRDFILILGCWFRPDGSLPPLLKGRVDRAIAFWRKQKAETGKEAFLIPTGGQGRDEPMPEGEAMRRYLLSQGIPDGQILPEKRAANTLQNMVYAKEIIQSVGAGKKTVFATTNYHLFRSGVWAGLAGLPAEGIGSRTRWWYWPNAFMAETLGLLRKRWWQELLFLLILIGFFGLLSMVVG